MTIVFLNKYLARRLIVFRHKMFPISSRQNERSPSEINNNKTELSQRWNKWTSMDSNSYWTQPQTKGRERRSWFFFFAGWVVQGYEVISRHIKLKDIVQTFEGKREMIWSHFRRADSTILPDFWRCAWKRSAWICFRERAAESGPRRRCQCRLKAKDYSSDQQTNIVQESDREKTAQV